MIIRNNNLISGQINSTKPVETENKLKGPLSNQQSGVFGNILNEKLAETQDLKFSKHAELRLKSRNIELTTQQKEKLENATEKAGAKGIKDSLVVMDNMAFVVNVKNKTVVTAMNGNELKDNIFTNIDGAVII